MTRSANAAHRLRRFVPAGLRPVVRDRLVRFRHLGLTAADAVLVSYPKSGSTWLRFLLGHVMCGQEVDFDSVRDALPPIGRHRRAPRLLPGDGRMVRTHEPLHAFAGPSGASIVYLVRDGRDVAVSYLHHLRRTGEFDGDLARFLPRFLSGAIGSYGAWHAHALEASAPRERGESPLLVIRYEDLRRDTVSELARIITFLGLKPENHQLEEVVAANSKERMRVKEQTSRVLQSQNTDGSFFVRPDGGPSWEEQVEPAMLQTFEEVAGAALQAFGYLPSDADPSP
jgi:Sulfotransferase domain